MLGRAYLIVMADNQLSWSRQCSGAEMGQDGASTYIIYRSSAPDYPPSSFSSCAAASPT